MQQQLAYKNSSITWYRFGTGPKPVFCFHGYGENALSFEFLGRNLGDQFSFYALDLPFHGLTEWNEGQTFSHIDLLQIIDEICIYGNQKPRPTGSSGRATTNNQKLLLMGYSLGGRVALSLCQAIPDKIEKLVLLAPDGLKVNFWYWLATQTWLGNKLFSLTMHYPGWFFGFLKLLNKLRLLNSSVYKFVNYYIGDKSIRILLYNRWMVLRKLRPNLARIKSFIREYKIPVRLIYGRHDRIILSSVGEKFKKGIETDCKLTVIESGHQVLHEKHLKELMPALLDQISHKDR